MLKAQALGQLLAQAMTDGISSALLLNTDGSLLSFQGVTPQRARTVATVVSNAWYAYDRHARPPPAAGVGLVLGGTPAAVDSGGEAEGQSELVIECEGGVVAVSAVGRRVLLCCIAEPETELGLVKAKRAHHLATCSDPACTGCDVGELDIDVRLVAGPSDTAKSGKRGKSAADAGGADGPAGGASAGRLTAADLYQAALEELAKTQLTDQDIDEQTHHAIVTKLFERSVEAFEGELRAAGGNTGEVTAAGPALKRKASAAADAGGSAARPSAAAILAPELLEKEELFASCLLDFGRFVGFQAYLLQGIRVLEACRPSWNAGLGGPTGWCLLGRCQLALAQLVHYPHKPAASGAGQDQSDDEDEENDGASAPTAPSKAELQLLASAQCNKAGRQKPKAGGTSKDKSKKDEPLVASAVLASVHRESSKAFLSLALSQRDHRRDTSEIRRSLESAINHAKEYFAVVPEDAQASPVFVDMQKTHGSCLYHLASLLQHSEERRVLQNARNLAREATQLLRKAVDHDGDDASAATFQLLGESAILWSSLEDDDDDAAVAAFEEASAALLKAYERDPENAGLRQQLVDLEMIDDNDDEDDGYEDEDEEFGQ
ncbi:Ragulator complex protein lamtor2 [Polyrhizophydium stewartii]|uniref:Ragulator complex protein lamtor2 n=1 Tax=Polyrhizophydium stewartii TaxID=2732419 RepID=A0ABR4N6T1_9FUNG